MNRTVTARADVILAFAFLVCAALLRAQAPGQSPVQTDDDEYTCYELLAPETQSFRIYYDVTATTPGAMYYFNGLRKGSEHTIHGVTDLMTNAPLEWKVVKGNVAREYGLPRAAVDEEFLQVKLARPVPAGGEARIRIDKTYKDAASYFREGDKLVFARSLGIKRNSVVLPAGYELAGCNYPSQIRTEADGRIRVSFMNAGPGAISYRVEARRLPEKKPETPGTKMIMELPRIISRASETSDLVPARVSFTFFERAFQDREIVYFLQQPETHAFRLYHDYTESREGMDHYLNVVRAGSSSSNPSAKILDTGEALKVETLKGAEAAKRGIKVDEPISPETEIVVIWFPAVKKGQSVRLRIEETYTDANRYLLVGDELVWDRSFGRPRNTVVLPEGWYVTANSIPVAVTQLPDGRIQLFYSNDRPDNIDVLIRARQR